MLLAHSTGINIVAFSDEKSKMKWTVYNTLEVTWTIPACVNLTLDTVGFIE